MQCKSSYEDILQSGEKQLDKGKYSQALDTFIQVLSIKTDDLKTLIHISYTYYRLRNHEKALEYLEQALKIQGKYIPALSQRGLVYKQKNQDDIAKSDWELIINECARTYEDWMGKSRAFFELADFQQCLNSLDRASKLNPEAYEPWMYRGITLSERDPQQALKSFGKAIDLNTEAYEPCLYQGITLGNMDGHERQALRSFSKAIELNPNADQAWMYRGITLSKIDRVNEALENFSKAISLNSDTEAWMYQGIVLSKKREKQKALDSFNCGLEIRADDARILWHRGITLYQLKKFEDALNDYDRAIAINTGDEKIWGRRSNCIKKLVELQNLEAVRTSRERISNISPDNAVGWFWHGNTLRELKDYKKAINSYNQATKINSNRKEAWFEYGLCLESLKEYPDAIVAYQKSIIIDTSYAEAHYHLGNVFRKSNNLEAALRSYEKAVEIDSDYEDAWYEQGKVLGLLDLTQDALVCYEEAIDINPENYAAYNGQGNSLNALGHFSEAITAFEKSLLYSKGKYWRACKNLGWLYVNSDQKSYDFIVQIWEDGLKKLYPEDKEYSRACGEIYHSIGKLYYRENLKQHKRIFLENAREKYESAISYLESDPILRKQCLNVLLDLYTVQILLREEEKAAEVQRKSSELLTRIIEECSDIDQKAKIAYEFRDISCLTVDSLIQSGQLVKALETAEQGKNACLTWLLSGWENNIKTSDWQKMIELTDDKTAIIYWHLSSISINTFLIKSDQTEPILINSLNLAEGNTLLSTTKIDRFQKWMLEWNKIYTSLVRESHTQLPNLINILKELLNISSILPQIEDITKLILIPHRDLHRVPLHILFPEDLVITYLPSIQTGINLPTTEFKTTNKLLSIECSGITGFPALPHAEIESCLIGDYFDAKNIHKISNANKHEVINKLNGEYSLLHFTGHAVSNLLNPKKSALALANNDRLTVENILNITFDNYHLVTLAACETAVTSSHSITEEYVGLVSAFLYQRVEHVLSTLWPVPDHPTSLMMAYFYSQLTKGKLPADALAESSKWLKTITYSELKIWYDDIFNKLPTGDTLLRPYIRSRINVLNGMIEGEKNNKCFEEYYYWASFTITGK